jgi:Zn-dependent alcohol dehydrogenase
MMNEGVNYLDEINNAIEDLKSGKVGRALIDFQVVPDDE